jgi:hypothetical protein
MFFLNTRPIMKTLAEACEKDPGLVLADNDIGHQIRYFTKCSVIANNFLLTPQHEAKINQMEQMFATPAKDLPRIAPLVKYVLVRPASIGRNAKGAVVYMSYSTGEGPLISDLLLKPTADNPVPAPAEYQLLHFASVVDGKVPIPYARLYKLHTPAAQPNASASR